MTSSCGAGSHRNRKVLHAYNEVTMASHGLKPRWYFLFKVRSQVNSESSRQVKKAFKNPEHRACITFSVLLNSPPWSFFLLKENALGFARQKEKAHSSLLKQDVCSGKWFFLTVLQLGT